MPGVLPALFTRRFLVVAGKGGVGRTTVTAVLATAAARAGLRVLVCQTKAKERLSSLFGSPPIGSDIVRISERISAVNMVPQVALREYGTMVLRSEFVAKQVLENRVSRAFLHAVPGVEDFAMLGKAWYHTTEQERGRNKYDVVLLDGPATGHVLTLLSIPDAILAAVPEGPLSSSARSVHELLRDRRRSAFVTVTLAEELPVNEATELARGAERMGLALGPVVLNGLFPSRFRQGASAMALRQLLGGDDGAHLRQGPDADASLAALLDSARLAERRRALHEAEMERLRTLLPLRQLQLPYLFRAELGPDAIGELTDRLMPQLTNDEDQSAAVAGP